MIQDLSYDLLKPFTPTPLSTLELVFLRKSFGGDRLVNSISSSGGRGRGGGREFMERGSAGGGRGRGGGHEIAPRFSEGGGRGRGINHGSTDNGGGRGRGLSHSSAAYETMARCSEGDDRGRRINNSNTENEIMERRLTGGRGLGGGHGSTNNELMARRSEGGGRGRVEIMQRSLEGGGRGQGCNHGRTDNGEDDEDDDDDEPAVVGRRGPSIPTRPPTTENRIWIWIEDDEFNIHNKVSRTIGSILKSLWSWPWQGWNDVPFHHRERMFERFQKYYVWEDELKSSIYSCWETCIKGKFCDLLMRARGKAKTLAIQEGVEVCDDLSVILPYKPYWISQEYWTTLVEAWNTQSWKGKSAQNSDNRSKEKGGRHTLGSNSFVTVRHKLDKTLKRRATFGEYWLQTHAKKGLRPLDRLVGESVRDGSGEVDDEEKAVHEQNVMWVDTKARESFETYKDYVMKKNEEVDNSDPEFDMDLWIHTTRGKKKGRLYGSGNIADPCVVMTGAPSTSRARSSYPPGRSDELERLKEQMEHDKVEKQAMREKIEENTRFYAEMNERLQLLS